MFERANNAWAFKPMSDVTRVERHIQQKLGVFVFRKPYLSKALIAVDSNICKL